MPFLSLLSVFFGLIIVANPDLIAYIIGFIMIFAGVNSLIFQIMMRRRMSSQGNKSWNFGNYEIVKKK